MPADVRLIEVNGLECNESILTGESAAAEKSLEPVGRAGMAESDRSGVHGHHRQRRRRGGVVYATGADAEFGRIAAGLGERQPETEFQARPAPLLLSVAVGGARPDRAVILITNLLLRRPVIDSVLFAPGDRGGHHAAAAAGGGQCQPGDRVAAAGAAQGSGQAVGVHRGPRATSTC